MRKATGKANTPSREHSRPEVLQGPALTGLHPATPSEFRVRRFGCGEVERAGGLGKREPGPTLLPFREAVPGPKSTLPHPLGWPKAQLLLHPKGTEAGSPPPRSEVTEKAASLFSAPHFWGKFPLKEGTQQPQTGTLLLCPSCFYPGGPTAIIRAPSAASEYARLDLAGGDRERLLGLF